MPNTKGHRNLSGARFRADEDVTRKMEAKTWQETIIPRYDLIQKYGFDVEGEFYEVVLRPELEKQAEITWNACLSQHPDLVAERKKIGKWLRSRCIGGISGDTNDPVTLIEVYCREVETFERGEGVE